MEGVRSETSSRDEPSHHVQCSLGLIIGHNVTRSTHHKLKVAGQRDEHSIYTHVEDRGGGLLYSFLHMSVAIDTVQVAIDTVQVAIDTVQDTRLM